MNYEELVKALRYCAESGDFNCNKDCHMYPNYPKCLTKMDMDAAAAIDALNNLVTLNTERCDGLREQLRKAQEQYEKHLNELEQQLPKQGEWVETEEKEWGIYPFKKQTCSVCDCKIDHEFMLACMDYFDDRDAVFHYCPNCGAKMEVQDEGAGSL